MDDDRLRAEARRVYRRYATEVIEAFGLCPWARRARLDGRVHLEVVVAPAPSPDDVLPIIEQLAGQPAVDIGLVIFPRVTLGRHAFRRFVSAVRERDAAHHRIGQAPFHMAAFHPDAEPDMASPDRLVTFIRRSPDPTIQLVRREAIDAVRGATPHGTVFDPHAMLNLDLSAPPEIPVHERVAIVNHATIERVGVDTLRAILDDIRQDRDRAYRALGGDLQGEPDGNVDGEPDGAPDADPVS